MSSIQNNITGKTPLAKKGLHVAIIRSDYNQDIVNALYENCFQTLLKSGVEAINITSVNVPGAFEIPFASQQLINKDQPDVVITLGCLIRGETPHFDIIAAACARGIMDVSLKTNVPIIFGVLTTENLSQAKARLDKGVEVALAAIEMTNFRLPILN